MDVIEYSSGAADVSQVVRSINDMTSMRASAAGHQNHLIGHAYHRNTAHLFWMVSFVVLALTLVGVSTTISSIVAQRRNEIGLRKAPASAGSIGAEFYVESASYGDWRIVGYGDRLSARPAADFRGFGGLGMIGRWVGSLALSVIVAVLASVRRCGVPTNRSAVVLRRNKRGWNERHQPIEINTIRHISGGQ